MISEKKLFLDRNDDIRTVVDQVISAPAERVILNIPKNSELGKFFQNFQILKRESITAGKTLVIESVDDHVLELAALAKLEAINPVFRVKERVVADILPRYTPFQKKAPTVFDFADHKPTAVAAKEIPSPKKFESFFSREPHRSGRIGAAATLDRKDQKPRQFSKYFRNLAIATIVLAILGVGLFFFATEILPRATVRLTLKKTDLNFSESIKISSKFTEVDITDRQKILLPGELLVARKNLEMTFDAHDKEKVETKAKGKIIIYNAYSSQPQPIVKGTRFVSPEGKVFRLDTALTIPPARVENGKIVPSQIEAAVTADEAGPEYNVPPSKNWRIPGFKGTPKYEGFYAEAVQPMIGGFLGERPKPTEDDLKLAREKVLENLKTALTGEIRVLLINDGFKFLEGASDFRVLDLKVQTNPQEPEKFSVWEEAELRYLVFKEEMLRNAIVDRAKRGFETNLRVRKFDINYENVTADFKEGSLILTANGAIQFEPDIDLEELKKNLLGVDEKVLRTKIFALPGLERATISLWPFWVKRVPLQPEKLEITAN